MSSLSEYKVITVTHHNINVNDIGHFFLRKSDSPEASTRAIKEFFGIQEFLYLETCNRVTYLMYSELEMDEAFLETFFSKVNPELEEKTVKNISKFVSTYEGEAALKHVFELASSMDSLVVGEREIFRQYRKAYEFNRSHGFTGDHLRLLDKSIVQTAKEVYHNTKIGEKPLSVVSLAISTLLKSNVNAGAKVLLIGAGETNALVAKFLKKYHFSDIKIYNRSLHNAQELSEEINADSFHIKELENVAGAFDVIFVCTSANDVIIDHKLYKQMLAGDTSQKTIIDLAVPRNVSLEVVEQNDVHHIDIEGLRKLSEENLEFRKLEVLKAKPIIAKNLIAFSNLFIERKIERSLAHVPAEIAAVKSKAINSVYKNRLEDLDTEAQNLVLEMMDYMEKKCVSVPMRLAKKHSEA